MQYDKRSTGESVRAAYELGHDLAATVRWHGTVWSCRQLAADGRAEFGTRLPPQATTLARDAGVLLRQNGRAGARAVRCVSAWATGAERMLRDLRSGRRKHRDVNWGAPEGPGERELKGVCLAVRKLLTASPHLARWFRAGEELDQAIAGWFGFVRDDLRPLRNELSVLRREGAYEFLAPVLKLLDAPRSLRSRTGAVGDVFDPVLGYPTLSNLDTHIRSKLAAGVAPEPVVLLRPDAVVFFGRTLDRATFHPAEWAILSCLCELPFHRVARETLVRKGGLRCEPRGIAPHVARLRKRLRPAVDARYAGEPVDAAARDCFIIGWKDEAGSYQLDLDKVLVRVES